MLEDYKEKQPILYKMIVNSVNKNKISHAYLIETNYNPAGFKFAVSFAKFLLCPYHKSKIEKCNSCTQCQRIDDNCFSELKVLKTDTLQIKKEQISDLQKEFSLKSVESLNKVYIIEDAEKLNDSSSATLLKFLEEPEANIIAILITPSKDLLLNTILSRCQILKMRQVKQINNSPEKELLDMLSIENQDEFIKDETNIEKFNSIKKFIKEIYDCGKDTILYVNKYWNNFLTTKEDYLFGFSYMIVLYKKMIEQKLKISNYSDEMLDEIIIKSSINKLCNQLNILLEYKEKIKFNLNLNLLMDKFIIDMEGVE